jgi:Na+/melibiose symporter-like transporter
VFIEEIFMCFSENASFGLSAVLAGTGVYCVKSALTKNRAFLCLAVIPLIFSIQQFAEGAVWRGLANHDTQSTRVAALVFLAFALAFWPFWIPLCGFILEPRGKKKWLLGCFALMGLGGGLALFVPLLANSEILELIPMNHSLHYDIQSSPVFLWLPSVWCDALYVAMVAVPPMVSRTNGFFLFSIGLVVAAAVSHVFFWYATASVWCFFAAMLSVQLCLSFRGLPMPPQKDLTVFES